MSDYVVRNRDGSYMPLDADEGERLVQYRASIPERVRRAGYEALDKYNAEAARHKAEKEKLAERLERLADGNTRERLRVTNLLRIATDAYLDASAKAMVKCFELGIPVRLSVKKPTATDFEKRIERLFR